MKKSAFAEKLSARETGSQLLQKAAQFGLDAKGLEILAIERGCTYYHDGSDLPLLAVSLEQFSNEELAVALLSPLLPVTPRSIRIAAAVLGTEDLDVARIALLARREQCEPAVRHIAKSGIKFEPGNSFWTQLLGILHANSEDTGTLPHPTRFVEMTGIDRGSVGLRTRWIRPNRRIAS